MQVRAIILAAALMLAPLGARAADLGIWWEEGRYPEEDAAVREIIAAFEKKTGKQVELTFHSENDLPGRTAAAVAAGHPPDIAYGIDIAYIYYPRWAQEGRLADLTDALVHPHRTPCASWFSGRSGRDASSHLRPRALR
jgi:multiple sugar transport system substrate-binding protein